MSNLNPVSPQARVSLSVFDKVSDDTSSAFLKYNVHQHNPVVVPSFASYDIKIGDPVYLYSDRGADIFPGAQAAEVIYITEQALVLSQVNTQVEIENSVLYYRAPMGDPPAKTISGISISYLSNEVVFSRSASYYDFGQDPKLGRSGVLDPVQAQALQTSTLLYSTSVTQSDTRVILPYIGEKTWLTGASIYSYGYSGTLTLASFFYTNRDHSLTDSSSWQPLTPILGLSSNSRYYQSCLEDRLSLYPPAYPPYYSPKPLDVEDMLGLRILSVVDPGELQLALHFRKVLN